MRNTNTHFGWLSIGFHWIIALTVFGLFILGYWMVGLGYYDQWYNSAPELHKSVGICLLILIVVSLVWRATQTKPRALENLGHFEQISANMMHSFLTLALFVVIFSGYFISTANGQGIDIFQWFEVPAYGSIIENQEDVAGLIHQYSAYIIVASALLHALAALKHHFLDKDRTLSRMITNKKTHEY